MNAIYIHVCECVCIHEVHIVIGKRVKQVRHSQVCSIEICDIYIMYILYITYVIFLPFSAGFVSDSYIA